MKRLRVCNACIHAAAAVCATPAPTTLTRPTLPSTILTTSMHSHVVPQPSRGKWCGRCLRFLQPLHPYGSLVRGCNHPARRLAMARAVMQLALSWAHSNLDRCSYVVRNASARGGWSRRWRPNRFATHDDARCLLTGPVWLMRSTPLVNC